MEHKKNYINLFNILYKFINTNYNSQIQLSRDNVDSSVFLISSFIFLISSSNFAILDLFFFLRSKRRQSVRI